MARPSQNIDQAFLRAGRKLFPHVGCAGLSVRALAEYAGANVGMFHYHFKTKDKFLDALLQGMYEEMFASFTASIDRKQSTLEKLRAALIAIAQFGRANRRLLARVWMDAMAGEKVAAAFFRRNAPRHLSVLFQLLENAEKAGDVVALPPLQRFSMIGGAILLPMIFVGGLIESSIDSFVPMPMFEAQVLSDDAIAQRVDLLLSAITVPRNPRSRRNTRKGESQ